MLDDDDPDLAATAVQDPWQSSEKFAACGDSTSTARALGCRIYLSGMPGSIDWPRRLGVSCSSSPEALACPTGVATQPNQLGIQNNNASASQSCLEYEVSLVSIGDAPHLGRPTFFGNRCRQIYGFRPGHARSRPTLRPKIADKRGSGRTLLDISRHYMLL